MSRGDAKCGSAGERDGGAIPGEELSELNRGLISDKENIEDGGEKYELLPLE